MKMTIESKIGPELPPQGLLPRVFKRLFRELKESEARETLKCPQGIVVR